MNRIYDIDRTRTLPQVLKNDPSILGAAHAIGAQMNLVAGEIHKNIIYGRMDELDETTLDILAHDLHVDWYDYSYPLSVKRAVIKNSVKIHRMLGTKAAVELGTGTVYPGSTVEEWFSYGGDPYYFRCNIDISTGGITEAQQWSLYEKIHFYKNCRSHLDYFNFQINFETEIRLGGYVALNKHIEIQPFLETNVDLETTVRVGGHTCTETALEIQPFLETNVDLETTVRVGGHTSTETALEIQPFLETNIDLEVEAGVKAATKTETALEIQPFLETNIDLKVETGVKAATKTETALEIQPFLETNIDLKVETGVKAATKTETALEIQPFLETGIDLEVEMEIGAATKTETSLEVFPLLTKSVEVKEPGEVIIGAETQVNQKIEIKEKEQ